MLSKFHESLFNMHSFLEKNMPKGLFFIASMQPINYLKAFLSKETLLDTIISLISVLFIKIGILCSLNLCFSIFSITKFHIFYPFLYMLSIMFIVFLIYNFTFFLFKLELAVNLQLQNCSWYSVLINFYVFYVPFFS